MAEYIIQFLIYETLWTLIELRRGSIQNFWTHRHLHVFIQFKKAHHLADKEKSGRVCSVV